MLSLDSRNLRAPPSVESQNEPCNSRIIEIKATRAPHDVRVGGLHENGGKEQKHKPECRESRHNMLR